MGDEHIEDSERRWSLLARAQKKLTCEMCGTVASFGERKVFLETGMCDYCAYKMNKP
jgi:hypothetical protein